jgi:hypothetical protein
MNENEIILGSKQLPRNTAKDGGAALFEAAAALEQEIWEDPVIEDAFEVFGDNYRNWMEENFEISPRITISGQYQIIARLKLN